MKILSIILLAASLFILLSACDKIEGPYYEEGNAVWNGRKSLLLDFTGHTCGNCPDGHRTIESILETYVEAVIPIAIHCGWYSRLESNSQNEPFYYDFRTEIGFELGGDGITTGGDLGIQGQPTGIINIMTGNALKPHTAWATEVAKYISTFPQYSIEIANQYDVTDSIITCNVCVESITSTLSDLNLVVYVVENNILQWQRDYDADPEDVENYIHNHVLRGGFNGTWGEHIGLNSSSEKTYQLKIGDDWVPENCYVVAFIYNAENKEVLQAEEAHIIEP
jgi:hypothetical protein